jgi:hypothetical protein
VLSADLHGEEIAAFRYAGFAFLIAA